VYKRLLKPLFFLLSPEQAHYLAVTFLKIIFVIPFGKIILIKYFSVKNKSSEKNISGLHFKNIVGLAAGFDKNAKWVEELSTLGFGFIEIGTVTPLAQNGNPKPRVFRLPNDHALINRMGFNNDGVDAVAERLKKISKKKRNGSLDIIVGGNIGKNKNTPNENAVKDYIICFNRLFDYVDYFVVNVSSPNTPNLRELQEKEPLRNILSSLQNINSQKENPKPVFLKIAPDLSTEQIDTAIEITLETKIAGIIAVNTTVNRESLSGDSKKKSDKIGIGGLSGKPLSQRAEDIIQYIKLKSNYKFVIIGSGGIFNADDAKNKLNAGADLVEVYTGMIYEGPGIVKKILSKL
jgi:dihydroorotate dehydrogenase